MNGILIDTGPLVALLDRNDSHHEICSVTAKEVRLPLLSCWPVITEAAYLLRRSPQAVSTLLAYCDGSLIEMLPLEKGDLAPMDSILTAYADQGFDLADVCLMHLANRERIETVFTLDQRHFSVFRTAMGERLLILPIAG